MNTDRRNSSFGLFFLPGILIVENNTWNLPQANQNSDMPHLQHQVRTPQSGMCQRSSRPTSPCASPLRTISLGRSWHEGSCLGDKPIRSNSSACPFRRHENGPSFEEGIGSLVSFVVAGQAARFEVGSCMHLQPRIPTKTEATAETNYPTH